MLPHHLIPALLLLLGSTASRADNCEAIRAQIDAKIKASGLARHELTVTDAGTAPEGVVVGSCGNGTRRIFLKAPDASGSSATSAPQRRQASAVRTDREAILTECLDGSMSVGATCKK
jgi:hypothetical protein